MKIKSITAQYTKLCSIHTHGTGGGGSGSHCRLFSPDQSEGLPLFVVTLTENSPEIEREREKLNGRRRKGENGRRRKGEKGEEEG